MLNRLGYRTLFQTQQNAFLNSNLALPMVREIGRVNSAKRFPELKSRASYGPRDRVALTQQNAFLWVAF